MPQANVNVGGIWKQVKQTGFWVKAGGAWLQVKSGYQRVAGTWRLIHQYSSLIATLTIGTSGGEYGFEGRSGTFGLLSADTLQNGKVVKALRWDHLSSGSVELALNGNGVPNVDATFVSVTVGALGTFNRSAASYNGAAGGFSVWSWLNNNAGAPTLGIVDATIDPA